MAETLHELVVALTLEIGIFHRSVPTLIVDD